MGVGRSFGMDAEAAGRERMRRAALRSREFNPDSRELRRILAELEHLLEGSEARVRRRVRLMFGELVAGWHPLVGPQALIVTLEVLPHSARLTASAEGRALTESEWNTLVMPIVLEFVDAWGIDRRRPGGAWFEFSEAEAS